MRGGRRMNEGGVTSGESGTKDTPVAARGVLTRSPRCRRTLTLTCLCVPATLRLRSVQRLGLKRTTYAVRTNLLAPLQRFAHSARCRVHTEPARYEPSVKRRG